MSVRVKISEGRGRPWGIFFGFYKTRHILLSDSAHCTVLRAVVLTQYQRVTDKRNCVASTALAKRRAVKSKCDICLLESSVIIVCSYLVFSYNWI